MATKKEKQLAIQLLKERIERLTGKKVMFKENAIESENIKEKKKVFNLHHMKILDPSENEMFLTDASYNNMYLYVKEKSGSWVLYDAKIGKDSRIEKGPSHRMSKIEVNITPLKQK